MFLTSSVPKKICKLLKLDKPLVIFDVETTGTSITNDKIIELAYIKIRENGLVKKDDMLLDPEMKISAETSAVHGIRNSDVRGKAKFRDKAQDLWEVFYGCYYSGFNVANFDLPILRREFVRVGMDFDYDVKQIVDTKEIYSYMAPRTLSSAYEYYCRRKFKQNHTALLDTEVSMEVLLKQLEKYNEARNWEFINTIHQVNEEKYVDNTRKFYWLSGEAYFAFSKYKDWSLSNVARQDPDFLRWILSAEFSEETKNIVKMALENNKK